MRGLIGFGVLVCVVAAFVVHPAPLPEPARQFWTQAASGQLVEQHVEGHTFVIDTVAIGEVTRPYTPRAIAMSGPATLHVVGWAFDPATRRTADRLVFRIDRGAWNSAQYHISRPDVAAALVAPEAADCGFRAEIATGRLPLGIHTVEFATVVGNNAPIDLTSTVALAVRGR